jgi:hypothetical protein
MKKRISSALSHVLTPDERLSAGPFLLKETGVIKAPREIRREQNLRTQNAQQGARANDLRCHVSCYRRCVRNEAPESKS